MHILKGNFGQAYFDILLKVKKIWMRTLGSSNVGTVEHVNH